MFFRIGAEKLSQGSPYVKLAADTARSKAAPRSEQAQLLGALLGLSIHDAKILPRTSLSSALEDNIRSIKNLSGRNACCRLTRGSDFAQLTATIASVALLTDRKADSDDFECKDSRSFTKEPISDSDHSGSIANQRHVSTNSLTDAEVKHIVNLINEIVPAAYPKDLSKGSIKDIRGASQQLQQWALSNSQDLRGSGDVHKIAEAVRKVLG